MGGLAQSENSSIVNQLAIWVFLKPKIKLVVGICDKKGVVLWNPNLKTGILMLFTHTMIIVILMDRYWCGFNQSNIRARAQNTVVVCFNPF